MSRAWPVPDLDPGASLASNARRILAVRIAELFSYAPVIPDAEAIQSLHDARIAAKRLRYSLELFRSIFGDEGEQAIEQIKALQEDLGQLHDHDVRIALIADELDSLAGGSADDGEDPKPGLEALLERERVAREKRHAAVVKRWQRLERDGLRAKLVGLSATPLSA
ncbi:MAG TPA: CHAD domain-containing protein [Thermomicrobiales bacterium]|nr:CHAD domain-containing protein [Thermomicrobiales bacterium]